MYQYAQGDCMKTMNPLFCFKTMFVRAATIVAISILGFQGSICQAGLVGGGGDLIIDGTNAKLFDPATPTAVINRYSDSQLSSARFIQIGFRTNNPVAFDITNIAWSRDNSTYTSFTPSSTVSNVSSPTIYSFSAVIDLGVGQFASDPFFMRYTLPAGLLPGSVVSSQFIANGDGQTTAGVLNDNGLVFASLPRLHTAVPEPTSLLLVASCAGGWVVRRWRKRSVASPANV
jgi:hypothetical protein